jgi:hypothetical protein
MNHKYFFLTFLSFFVNGDVSDYYDNEDKDNLLESKESYQQLLKIHSKKGYIEYSEENIKLINQNDMNGDKIPFLLLIVTGSNCSACRPLKTGNTLEELSRAINDIFATYQDKDSNNTTGSILLVVTVNLDEYNSNLPLRKFLNPFPPCSAIPTIMLVCRKKNCKNKSCDGVKKHPVYVKDYRGISHPLSLWIKNIIENILREILVHGFEKPLNTH